MAAGVDPSQWLRLAKVGARRAKVPEHLREDAAAEAVLSFAKKPPKTEAQAIVLATFRALDFFRSWSGHRSGRPEVIPESVLGEGEYYGRGATDPQLAAVDLLDLVESSQLTRSELQTLAAQVAGVPFEHLAAVRGRSKSWASVIAARMREKLGE